jgi:hypothetical protein
LKIITLIVPCHIGERPLVLDHPIAADPRVLILVEEGVSPSVNRNRGMRKVETEFFGFINAHAVPECNWLDRALDTLRRWPGVDVVGGPQLTLEDRSLWAQASGIALGSAWGAGGMRWRYAPGPEQRVHDGSWLTGTNMVCRAEGVKDVPFNEAEYPFEENLWMAELKRRGYGLGYDPGLLVFNRRRGTPWGLAWQMWRYGVQRGRLGAVRWNEGPGLAAGWVVLLAGSLLGSGFWSVLGWLFPAYLALQVAWGLGCAALGGHGLVGLLAGLPAAVIHCVYGAGVLAGRFSVWRRGSRL